VFSYDHRAFEQRDHLRLLAIAPHLANPLASTRKREGFVFSYSTKQ
jgi:hypothetical protein